MLAWSRLSENYFLSNASLTADLMAHLHYNYEKLKQQRSCNLHQVSSGPQRGSTDYGKLYFLLLVCFLASLLDANIKGCLLSVLSVPAGINETATIESPARS